MPDIAVLNVKLHGKAIGTITHLPDDRNLFAFDQAYIEDSARDTLSLSFKDEYGGLDSDTRPTKHKLPTFFSNVLPEGRLRDYLAERAGVHREREFFLIWVLGRDLAGAVEVEPADGESWPEAARQAVASLDSAYAPPLRFSLAGVQLKFSALKDAAGGLTVPVNGVGGSWIVKLPSERHPLVPENEYAMMELARRVDIDVPQTDLIPIDRIAGLPEQTNTLGAKAFVIKRFDRLDNGERVHIEDFTQIFGLYAGQKYKRANFDMIARVLAQEAGEAGVTEFIRRFVFNALIGNGDMHLKNWSVIYPDRRTAAIAPAYDFVSTIVYMKNEALALNFADTKAFADLNLERFERFAAKAQLSHALVRETVKATVSRFHDVWRARADLALPANAAELINLHLKQVPIAAL